MTWPISTGVSAEPAAAKEQVRPTPRASARNPKTDWFSNAFKW
jgi:hypothetical protein